jgi:hypothetical protein
MLCEDSGLIVGLKLGFNVEEGHEAKKGRRNGVADRKDDLTRAPFISFCRCRVENKKGRILRT